MSHLTFKKFLTEIFQSNTPFNWIYNLDTEAKAQFTIDNTDYVVLFGFDDYDNFWDVTFDIKDDVRGREPYSPTGFGKSFSVLSVVKQILIDFLLHQNNKVYKIRFSADSESRKKAYNILAKSILSGLPKDWQLRTVDKGVRKYILYKQS